MIDIIGAKMVDEFLEAFPVKTSIAIRRAVTRGTNSTRTYTNRVAAKDMGLKVGVVRKRTRAIPPRGDTLTGEVRASLKRVTLYEYSKKRRPKHSFVATMPSGHTGIFVRKGNRRLPIRELRGASVGRVVALHSAGIIARGGELTGTEINRQLTRLIRG